MTRLLRRLRYLLQRDRYERELDDELQFHLEMKRQELESQGRDRAAAAAAARRSLGNLPLTRDRVRDVWIAPWLAALVQDVKYAARTLRRSPRFALVVVLTLGLGIGVSTTAFTVVNAVTRGLPVDEPDRIVQVGVLDASQRPVRISPRELEVWRSASTVAGIAAFSPTMATVSERGRLPEPVAAAYVSADTFGLLGERPVLGRAFLPQDDRPGAPVVALLGDAVWRSRFNGDRSILDRSITVNDVPVTIVGVMPTGFRFPMVADLWLPLSAMPGYGEDRTARVIDVVGRPNPRLGRLERDAARQGCGRRIGRDVPRGDPRDAGRVPRQRSAGRDPRQAADALRWAAESSQPAFSLPSRPERCPTESHPRGHPGLSPPASGRLRSALEADSSLFTGFRVETNCDIIIELAHVSHEPINGELVKVSRD